MRIDERHTSELLGQSTRTMVLPSGLTVQMCRMPGFVTAYAMLTVGVGSIDIGYRVRGREVSLPAGVAHYLEHKMFDCPYGDAMQRFDALGASANAFTSFDKTAYYFSCTENFSKALEVLLDFVATPYFTGPSVRRERGIIAEELRMYRDSPEWIVTANLLQAMYHVHPIREDIAGTEESIAHIDAALLRRCYERFYCPGNMVLSVAGCFEEDAVLELAEKYFPTAKTAANPLTIREPRTVREHYCEQKMPIAAPMFQVGFKAAGGEKENMRHRLLDELLLDLICGETTDLYRRLYEAGEINATFGSEVMAGRDFICAMFDGESRQPQAVYEALCERVTTLQRQGIPPQDFARCRRANYGRTIGLYGRAESIAGLMAAAHFSGMKDIYYPLEILRSTTVEELEQRLQEDYDPTTSALSVIWPQGNP